MTSVSTFDMQKTDDCHMPPISTTLSSPLRGVPHAPPLQESRENSITPAPIFDRPLASVAPIDTQFQADKDGQLSTDIPKGPNYKAEEDMRVAKVFSIISRQGPDNGDFWPMCASLYNTHERIKRSPESLSTRFGTISRNAQKYNRARTKIVESIPSGHTPTESDIRKATMDLYCNSNKYCRKGTMYKAPKIKYIEACLFLRNEPKYKGLHSAAGPATAPIVPQVGDTGVFSSAAAAVSSAPETPVEFTASNTISEPHGGTMPASVSRSVTPPATGSGKSAASRYARPVGVKKSKKQLAWDEQQKRTNRLAAAVAGVGTALTAS